MHVLDLIWKTKAVLGTLHKIQKTMGLMQETLERKYFFLSSTYKWFTKTFTNFLIFKQIRKYKIKWIAGKITDGLNVSVKDLHNLEDCIGCTWHLNVQITSNLVVSSFCIFKTKNTANVNL